MSTLIELQDDKLDWVLDLVYRERDRCQRRVEDYSKKPDSDGFVTSYRGQVEYAEEVIEELRTYRWVSGGLE